MLAAALAEYLPGTTIFGAIAAANPGGTVGDCGGGLRRLRPNHAAPAFRLAGLGGLTQGRFQV
jgi:hypothetical protein